ncbi:MAG: molecular chaperone DnaK [Thaumarchaeota archaeon]|nr:molecular chaperone DnaK [Nitrososphaerota archaeon]
MSSAREKIIGIDLGTTNSAGAVVEGGRPVVIPSAEGATPSGKMFPSVVAFTAEGQLLVGEPARRQVVTNPEGTVFEIKRKMGTDYRVSAYGKQYSPEQVSAFILQKIKHDAEVFLGYPVKKAVITVPAHFNDNQRQATKDAGEIAGLDVVRIINEPTAASLAYGLDKSDKEMKILVFSFGGGTHDATIMEFGQGVFQVLATSGDTQTGGTDIDNAVINVLVQDFRSRTGIDLGSDRTAMARLKEAAEKAKIELSNLISTDVDLPFIASDQTGPKNLHYTLTRTKLEEVARPIISRTEETIRRVMGDAKLTQAQVDKVVLIGGMTRMPLVRKFVEDVAGRPAERGVDPMEAVAVGAAIQGAVLAGEIKDILLLDVTPLSMGVETLGGITEHLIEKNATIPTKRSKVFTTAADFQTAVTIHVVQGERSMAADNVSLGMFNLTGIPPSPRGVPQIEVTFDIDANGILTVAAKDTGTGKENKITITASTKLSKEEKERLVRDAEAFADQDKMKRQAAELRNEADSVLYTTERTKRDLEGKVEKASLDRVDAAAQALRKALEGNDTEAIRAANEELKKVLQEVGASVYQKAQQAAPPGGGGDGAKVSDAEYKVVDEGK